MKIAVYDSLMLMDGQLDHLRAVGEVSVVDSTSVTAETLQTFDAICADEPISGSIYGLNNKLVSFPFVGVGWLDLEKLRSSKVAIANAPGCNKDAVSEWIIAMMLIMSRKLGKYMGLVDLKEGDFLESMLGMTKQSVLILGHGHIGKSVAKKCQAFDMEVSFYKRGDDLLAKAANVDFVVNCMARNTETEGLLSAEFFNNLKNGSYFVSVTDLALIDLAAMKQALETGKLAGAAVDPAGIPIFATQHEDYKALLGTEHLIVTPHIAFHTDRTLYIANEIMVENVIAWGNGKPQNIVN